MGHSASIYLEGDDISPFLAWSGIASGIGSLVLIVVATPAKPAQMPMLHVDMEPRKLNMELAKGGCHPMITDQRRRRITTIDL